MQQDKETLFDTEFGLNQLSGNRDLLIKMLDRFAADYASVGQELQDAVAQQDVAIGKAKAHTIKGVAGNLGLWKLHHSSKELEELFKAPDSDFTACLASFNQVMSDTFAALEQFKSGDSAPNDTGTPVEETPPGGSPVDAKAELTTLLEGFEFIDADNLQQLLKDAAITEDKRDEITQAISDLDYPSAIELLNS
ncbi:Hpt domain-containing protein [Planctobacterium marinum]